MNIKCQVFTPQNYVEKLLDSVGYKSNLFGKRLLENSCGEGNILIEAVRRYIADCKRTGLSIDLIQKGLSKDIVGIEIDKKHFNNCISNLNNLLDKEKIPRVHWQIFNDDFFKINKLKQFQFIVGNPPYITYSELKTEQQFFLKKNFISCKNGKFDYCYAFIEKSLSLLAKDGKMSYLIPSSIFKNVFGENLRYLMLPYLTEIQDFTQEKVFDSALVKSSIVVLEANNKKNSFSYFDYSSETKHEIIKDNLEKKWLFKIIDLGTRRFGDYFKVSHSVATLLNDAFVLTEYKINEKGNYVYKDFVIESEFVFDAASPKSIHKDESVKILFPYYLNNEGILSRYEESDIIAKFPGAYNYLLSFKNRLLKRNSDKKSKWFEYGRSQALTNLFCEKCLISTVFSNEFRIYKIDKYCVPYAGMFIVRKNDNNQYNLDDAMRILRSLKFKQYVESIGVHISGSSLRITSKDIENYMF